MEQIEQITPFLFLDQEEAKERKKSLPTKKNLDQLSEFFKIFGDHTRLRILFFLKKGELCVGDLSASLNMTPSAISHQLKILKQAELVHYRREGKILFYSLADHHVSGIIQIGLEHIKE